MTKEKNASVTSEVSKKRAKSLVEKLQLKTKQKKILL